MANLSLDFDKNASWFLGWGVVLIFLGIVGITAATFTTIATVIFLGALMLAAGVLVLIDSFHFWKGSGLSFLLHLAMGILYCLVGLICILGPIPASVSITFILGIFFIVLGIFRIMFSAGFRFIGWQWSMLSGILAIVLGILILANWPASGLVIIGMFVGIDLVIAGWYYVMMSLFAKKLNSK